MGLARLLGFCAALLFASSVVNAATIDVGPSDYRNYGLAGSHTTGGVRSTFGQQVRLPPTVSGPTRLLPVSRNAVIPYGSIANGAKNFLRINPASAAASAAITAMFLGLDWAFDDELDSWMKEGETYGDPVGDTGWYYGSSTNEKYATPDLACDAQAKSIRYASGYTVGSIDQSGNTYYKMCRGVRANGTWVLIDSVTSRGLTCPSGYSLNPQGLCARSELIDLDPSDWTRLENELPNRPGTEVATAGRDIMQRQGAPLPGYHDVAMSGPSSVTGPETTSTSTDPVTGDTIVTTTSTTTNINYGDTTITTSDTTTSTTYQNGQETSTTVTTETPGELPVSSGGAAGDWPAFCDWASVVCDWLNWTREPPPPEQDLPVPIDEDFYREKSIDFGSKTCPPDYEINIPFINTTVAVPMQPLCDFAGIIYFMVMASAYIYAAYISVGVARNG